MSNLLPKARFTSRFKQIVPQELPTSEENDDFEDDDIEYDTPVTLRNPLNQKNDQEYPEDEDEIPQDDIFDRYSYGSLNPVSYFTQNSEDEEENLPPPPPEDELQVNFSFNEALSSHHQDDVSSSSSVSPSPLPPKLTIPSKAPPPPPPPIKPVATKVAPPAPNDLKKERSRVDVISQKRPPVTSRVNPSPTRPPIHPPKILPKLDPHKNTNKEIEVDNNVKADWGNIAAIIASKPQLKKSSENRNIR